MTPKEMTSQEAIEIITNAIQTDNMTAEQDKALAMAQKALGKQITKKVIRKKCDDCTDDCDCTKCDYYFDRCPNCKVSLINDCGAEDDFCFNCGQALDWSDEE